MMVMMMGSAAIKTKEIWAPKPSSKKKTRNWQTSETRGSYNKTERRRIACQTKISNVTK